MKENITKIESSERIGRDAFRIRFAVDWPAFTPGQFVMVEAPDGRAFLRRPFGIARLTGGHAEICVKVVGKGTCALAHAPAGTPIAATGPCGRGFASPADGRKAVLVAGGYGIGPMIGLAERLAEEGRGSIVYYGAKSSEDLLYLDQIKSVGAAESLSTEDGSAGTKGMITERLARDIGSIDRPALYACGPEGLVRAVARLGISAGIPTQVSMDAYMACGIGVCMGCVCRDAKGNFVRTCREGPVFDAKELRW